MAGCKIDADASPQFNELRNRWKKCGYPSIDTDLADAFANIQKDLHANQWKRVPRFSASILKGYELYKYRQKNKAAREGASGGWRIYALFKQDASMLYPIIVFPKKAMTDADDDTIKGALTELLKILEGNLFSASE